MDRFLFSESLLAKKDKTSPGAGPDDDNISQSSEPPADLQNIKLTPSNTIKRGRGN